MKYLILSLFVGNLVGFQLESTRKRYARRTECELLAYDYRSCAS